METIFLTSSIKQFKYYRHLGRATIDQLSDEDLFKELTVDSNSIAIIVNHLHGNMVSRWTDFLTTDGEKEYRNRDAEFENMLQNRQAVLQAWDKGWDLLIETLESLQPRDLHRTIYIRNQGHSVVEAIQRQLCHYSYHVGQIVYIGKVIKGKEWVSLSIPKNQSKQYNEEKFNQKKSNVHFTDEYINNPDPQ
ncbi:DUF1572 family protein [Membranihabitans marinus]|uniref:DUF1572 family protein n=1 Tax=Membranihabitans marinus TaxID=1227546 RepID=UPI001F232D8F|nr:DUF1572 family protein [Membranihabitans marinus]